MSEGFWDYDRVTGEWGVRFPFNVNSSKQMIGYMRAHNHPVPRNPKTKEDTSSKDEIERLAKKYPKDALYKLVVGRRELGKILTTYIDGYLPMGDGRIHPNFTFTPSTGRLACEKPNFQNVPARGDLAKEFRRQFIPSEGCVFLEADYRAIEAVLVGWLAGDSDYIRAAKLGIHAILASHVLAARGEMPRAISMSLPDDVIREVVALVKRDYEKEYDDCKHAVHGGNYGATAFKLHMSFPKSFPTIKSAEDILKLYFGTLGKKVRAWQRNLLMEAHQKHYLDTVFGFRRYFYDVFHWDVRKQATVMGADANEVIAFPAQSMARCIVTNAMKSLDILDLSRLLLMIHDSLLFEIPQGELAESKERIVRGMEQPVLELGGLVIEVECKTGISWGSMRNGV